MSRIWKATLILLVLIGAPLSIVIFRPELVLTTLAKPVLRELGYEITELEVLHLGINSTAVQQLALAGTEETIVLSRIQAHYSLTQLLAGTLQSVSIGKIEVHMLSTADPVDDEIPTTLASLLDTFDELPVRELVAPTIEVTSSDQSYTVGLGLQGPPLYMAGEAHLAALADTIIEFDMRRTAADRLSVETRALLAGAPVLESTIDLTVSQSGVTARADSTVFMEPLRSQLQELLPAATRVLNDTLSLRSSFDMQDVFGELSLHELSLVLDSPASQLQISQDSDLGSNTLQLRLPLTIEGEIATASGEMQLALSEILGTGNWNLSDATSRSEHRFENTRLHCLSFTSCDMRSDWSSVLSNWQYGEYSGENSRVAAALRLDYSNAEMRLASDRVQIAIPSVNSASASAFSTLSTNMELDELELRVGDVISGGFNFTSNTFSLENSHVELSEPGYSGKLQLEEDVLTGIVEIDLDRSLRLGIGLQHFFLRDTGDVVLQLAAHQFSDTAPLSALLRPKQLDADIVAGGIEGLANISWSKQLDESWRFGGPIALKIEQLSGYYADYLFVDFSTDLFAEATTPLGIQVANPASASLGRIDIGLPLEDLSWRYRFDTLSEDLQISDFETALLGGKLSIPGARYNPARERQQVDVVLSDIRVDSLVNLADYPNLQADGLISGYLPFIIEGNTVTIERGLVGALNPGGSIRYTPANPAPSSNQSLQLVNQALSNYQYQTMNTEVTYDEEGELLLSVQLRGSNPGMNNGQAINLNVNITDNVPSLLRSLQASRAITDELERLVNRR